MTFISIGCRRQQGAIIDLQTNQNACTHSNESARLIVGSEKPVATSRDCWARSVLRSFKCPSNLNGQLNQMKRHAIYLTGNCEVKWGRVGTLRKRVGFFEIRWQLQFSLKGHRKRIDLPLIEVRGIHNEMLQRIKLPK